MSKLLIAGLLLAGLAVVTVQAAAPSAPQGVITAKAFLNIGGGTAVADLTGNAKFPDSPDVVTYPPYFEWAATGDITTAPGNWGDNYGTQIVGYFYPPASGDYVFYLASDDGAALYLSTDADPANKKLIARESGWSNARSYAAIGGGSTVEEKSSQTFTGTDWPTKDAVWGGAKITLQANRAYYIEALNKEGGGGDNLSVAVQDPNFVIDSTLPIPGEYLATFDKTSGPVTITRHPASQSVNEGDSVTFSVEANGTPPYTYQWTKNGTDIAGATGQNYTIARAAGADNGATFACKVTGAQGSATSNAATLTVAPDTTPPTLASARGSVSFTSMTVVFSEPVQAASATAVGNYSVSPSLTLSGPVMINATTVLFTTSRQTEGTEYTLTVNNVKDDTLAGNTIAANSQITFKAFVRAKGFLTIEFFTGIGGTPVANLLNAQKYIDNAPDETRLLTRFDTPNGYADNYGARVTGWLVPKESGNYWFFTRSDDASQLFLNETGEAIPDPLVDLPIAEELDCCDAFMEPETFDAATSFAPIALQAGRRYGVLFLLKEGGGGDWAQVAWRKDTDTTPAANLTPIPGSVLETYADVTGAFIEFTTPPVDTEGVETKNATFTVVANTSSPFVGYQWLKNGTEIAGATGTSYTTPKLTLSDNGTKYSVRVTIPGLEQVSPEATLTVVPDSFPPELSAVGSLMRTSGAIEIGVGFDEEVEQASASAAANYTLSKGTVTGVRYQRFAHPGEAIKFVLGTAGPFNGYAVVLETSGLAGGDKVTVTVKNVTDLKGNPIPAAGVSKSVTITQKMKWAAMGGTDYLEGAATNPDGIVADPALWPDDAVAYSESDFDLISGGTANWANYDEATFVYEEVTGDFDKVVRVEYHDPTSQWARAGLCATPNHDEGVTRADATAGVTLMAKRYMLRANPAVQWNGSAGNNQNEADWRLTDGGNYGGTGTGTPAYPNAWLRMKREGQTFTGFYSSDGLTWTSYGAQTFTTEPMPDTLLVGPYYSPEMNNNNTGPNVGHSSMAKFRQYGNFPPSAVDYGIGLNFGADEYPNSPNAGTLPATDNAGVPGFSQANWNNLTGATGNSSAIVADVEGTSQPTAVTVTWTCPNTWSTTGRGEENNALTGPDQALMIGYLDTGAATTTTVTIEGLPPELTENGYDVIVYALGGVPGRGGGYRVVDAATGTALTDYVRAQGPANPTGYVEAVPDPDPTVWSAGDYIHFAGLASASIKVEATTAGGFAYGGTPRAPINAIQLFAPPTQAPKPPAEEQPEFTAITLNADGTITVEWINGGTLQAAPTVLGPWQDVTGTSPYTFTPSDPMLFGRIKK